MELVLHVKKVLSIVTVPLLALSCAPAVGDLPDASRQNVECQSGLQYLFSFGSSGTLPSQFRSPSTIRIDSFGNLLVADTGNNRIQKFDRSGSFLMEFGTLGSSGGGLNRPTDCVDNSLSIYVVDSVNERVVEYDSEGQFVSVCFDRDRLGQRATGFRPVHVGFSNTGYIFVSDLESDALMVFSNFWEPLTVVGGFGAGEGRFEEPGGIAVNDAGEILVCDTGNRRVQVLGPTGNFLKSIEMCAGRPGCEPVDVAVGEDGTIYVADSGLGRVVVLSADGRSKCEFAEALGKRFVHLQSVAVSARGTLYVLDGGTDTVHAFEVGKDVLDQRLR
jgi:tripartite motif-containing protein 71